MTTKAPVTRPQHEIQELNLEFLDLLRRGGAPPPNFSLEAAVCQRIRCLTVAQVDTIAGTPCLLAGFTAIPPFAASRGVAEPLGAGLGTRPAETARMFAAGLMNYLWQTARQDRLLAALCMGPWPVAIDRLAGAGFRDIQASAAEAVDYLEARFCRHPRLWPDLVRAATAGNAELLAATRLSVVQLTLVARPPDGDNGAPGGRRWAGGHSRAR